VLCFPQFKFASTALAGVPVKNYIGQSQEFNLGAFALAMSPLICLRERQFVAAAGIVGLLLTFVVNMLLVVSARTAVVYIPAFLALFASLHLNRGAMLALFATVVVTIILVWSTSSYLRDRGADMATQYQPMRVTPSLRRLSGWSFGLSRSGLSPWPLVRSRHRLNETLIRAGWGRQTGLRAEVSDNPRNQPLPLPCNGDVSG
jgi:O-antigen ligase